MLVQNIRSVVVLISLLDESIDLSPILQVLVVPGCFALIKAFSVDFDAMVGTQFSKFISFLSD